MSLSYLEEEQINRAEQERRERHQQRVRRQALENERLNTIISDLQSGTARSICQVDDSVRRVIRAYQDIGEALGNVDDMLTLEIYNISLIEALESLKNDYPSDDFKKT
jgi:ABC-type glycerol-3-phosphate transport system substrate-binding protein